MLQISKILLKSEGRGIKVKKVLSFITSLTIISCQKQTKKEVVQIADEHKQTIHEQIKDALKETLQFNEDWIIDYHQEAKNIEQFINILTDEGLTYLGKTIAFLVKQRLEKEIKDLFVKYHDFTLSVTIVQSDTQLIIEKLLKNEPVNFHYDFYYNLQALQDIDFTYLDNYPKDRGKLALFNSEFGQYSLLYKDGNKNRIKFKQKEFINNDKNRLDYLATIINITSAIKINDQYYKTFVFMVPKIDTVASVSFELTDFKDKNLVKLIHDDPTYFLKVKDLIIKNLKANIISKQFTNIKDLFESMPTIVDDIELNIDLEKAYLTSEIQNDENLNNIYGSSNTVFANDMLLLKLKTTLKSKKISAATSIDETIALDIEYK